MPIEVVEINSNQFDEIIKFEEGHFLDLKSIEIRPAKLTKSISGFANADGGELYIGIKEKTVEFKRLRRRGFIENVTGRKNIHSAWRKIK